MKSLQIDQLYEIFLRQEGCVTTDSRAPQQGAVFFALSGERFNGNSFAAQALANGCSYVVVDDVEALPAESCDDPRYLLTDSVLRCLQALATLHRQTLGTRLIGITGTNGKTTTKELLSAVLRKRYNVLATEGNLNNHIGVPLTLLKLRSEHELGIIEMGASRVGDIRELAEIAQPDYGLITNVGRAHLEGFGSFEGVIRTKGELFDWAREQGGQVFVNPCAAELMQMASGLNLVRYVDGSLVGQDERLSFEWQGGVCRTQLIGDYNLDNALAAATIGLHFGVSLTDINAAIEEYMPQNGRSQRKQTARNTLIIDAYNANPTSMRASLESFARVKASLKGVILGAMRELGEETDAEHATVVHYVDTLGFERVIYVGEEFKKAVEELPREAVVALTKDIEEEKKKRGVVEWYPNVEELKARFTAEGAPMGYTLLLKGSNSIRLTELIDML